MDIEPFPSNYKTESKKISWMARHFPSLFFYPRMVSIIFKGAKAAKRGEYDNVRFYHDSVNMIRFLEATGARVDVENLNVFKRLQEPCVIVANHMSVMETFVLPCLILGYCPVTFVIKQSLMDYPVFKHIMRTRDPIVVTRENPREDLKTVLTEGQDRLKKGVSVILFPQTTRSLKMDESAFNTLGIKLAQRAGVPVLPLALKTNCWGNGRLIKDFGKIDPSQTIHFKFGEPLRIKGKGKDEHQKVVRFIKESFDSWC